MANYYNQHNRPRQNDYRLQNNYTTAPVNHTANRTPNYNQSSSAVRRTRSPRDDNDDFMPVNHRRSQANDYNFNNDNNDWDQRQQRHLQEAHTWHPIRSQNQQRSQRETRIPRNSTDADPSTIPPIQHTTHQDQEVSEAATRYAQTRFPFAPIIIRFSSGNISEKVVSLELEKHFKDVHHVEIQIMNIRRSTVKCQRQHEYDHLIFVKDTISFCELFNQQKWPQQISGEAFSFPSTPSFPPQLSLIMKNVDLQINTNELFDDLKSVHLEIHNVIRLKNKHQNEIKLVKLEILSTTLRDELLNVGSIRANGMIYDIEEYLSPATVLICTKCRGIGHFRRQCNQTEETCNVCGTSCPDLRQHHCSNITKCIHCGGNHLSNSTKCPIIKDFRADLTKKLLSCNSLPMKNDIINNGYVLNPTHYPPLPQSQFLSINNNSTSVMNKIDELLNKMDNKMDKINDLLINVVQKQCEFDKFMKDKNKQDEDVMKKVENLTTSNVKAEKAISTNGKLIKKLILPTLELISNYLYHANMKPQGIDNADFKTQIETIRTMLDSVMRGKEDLL